MSFKKYSSIENHYRGRTVQSIRELLDTTYPDMQIKWTAREKIHGTNMSWLFEMEDRKVSVCKRSGSIPENELSSFFRADLALQKAKDIAEKVFSDLEDINSSLPKPYHATAIQIFGEWAGSGGEDLPAVQKGVFYNQGLEFYVFDVLMHSNNGGTSRSFFMDEPDLRDFIEDFDLNEAPIVGEFEDFEEALKINNTFNSVLAPGLEDNIAEGVVLKPFFEMRTHNGERVILKSKAEKWVEKDARNKAPKAPVELPDVVKNVLGVAATLVTKQRLEGVVGKIGPGLKPNDYIGPFSEDLLIDLAKELEDEGILLTGDEYKLVKKNLPKLVVPLIMREM